MTVALDHKHLYSGLAEFAASRSGPYDYLDLRGCAFAQYLESEGVPFGSVSGMSWYDDGGEEHDFPRGIREALAGNPETFEALTERLRELNL